jgi:DNA repair protein RecO (recombination protein O)
MLNKDLAICIKTIDYSETSQIVTLFTKGMGKINAIAKGSKRSKSAFGGPLEIFSYGEIAATDSTEKNLSTLTEFVQRPAFKVPIADLFGYNCAMFAAELLGKLTKEHDPHPQLFESCVQFLKDVSENGSRKNILALFILFQITLLKEIGLQPTFSRCLNCEKDFDIGWGSFFFSSRNGGFICRDCEPAFADKVKLSVQSARTLNDLKMIVQADEQTLEEIERTLVHYFTEVLHKKPKMAGYILGAQDR